MSRKAREGSTPLLGTINSSGEMSYFDRLENDYDTHLTNKTLSINSLFNIAPWCNG